MMSQQRLTAAMSIHSLTILPKVFTKIGGGAGIFRLAWKGNDARVKYLGAVMSMLMRAEHFSSRMEGRWCARKIFWRGNVDHNHAQSVLGGSRSYFWRYQNRVFCNHPHLCLTNFYVIWPFWLWPPLRGVTRPPRLFFGVYGRSIENRDKVRK